MRWICVCICAAPKNHQTRTGFSQCWGHMHNIYVITPQYANKLDVDSSVRVPPHSPHNNSKYQIIHTHIRNTLRIYDGIWRFSPVWWSREPRRRTKKMVTNFSLEHLFAGAYFICFGIGFAVTTSHGGMCTLERPMIQTLMRGLFAGGRNALFMFWTFAVSERRQLPYDYQTSDVKCIACVHLLHDQIEFLILTPRACLRWWSFIGLENIYYMFKWP